MKNGKGKKRLIRVMKTLENDCKMTKFYEKLGKETSDVVRCPPFPNFHGNFFLHINQRIGFNGRIEIIKRFTKLRHSFPTSHAN